MCTSFIVPDIGNQSQIRTRSVLKAAVIWAKSRKDFHLTTSLARGSSKTGGSHGPVGSTLTRRSTRSLFARLSLKKIMRDVSNQENTLVVINTR